MGTHLDSILYADVSAHWAVLATWKTVCQFVLRIGSEASDCLGENTQRVVGAPACSWQEGGWKAADSGKLVGRAINEVDKWVENDTVLRDGVENVQIPDGYDKDRVCSKVPLYADGVEAEIEAESEADMSTVDSDDEEL